MIQPEDNKQVPVKFYALRRTAAAVFPRRVVDSGRTAVWQARLVLLVLINITQLWILSATIEAALAGHYRRLVPLIAGSALCWLIALTIFLWWKPVARRRQPQKINRER